MSAMNSETLGVERSLSHSEQNQAAESSKCLPTGFPRSLDTGLAWKGFELLSDSTYIYSLTIEDKLEIDAALIHFLGLGLDGDLVDRGSFPIPRFQNVLLQLRSKVHQGVGFVIIRGLDLQKYSVEHGMIIFLGISSFIAEKRGRQDDMGNMIVHIIPDSIVSPNPVRSFHSRHSKSSIPFHTEAAADILAWQTRSIVNHGGKVILASAYTIYNELAATRPDIIHTLAQPNWPCAFPYYHERPILFYHEGKIIFNFSPAAILGSKANQRLPSLPSASALQLEALKVIQHIAEKNKIEFTTKPGDLHFVNNLAILHRRDAFVQANNEQRHMVRLYLRNEEIGWSIPAALKPHWEAAFEGEQHQVWHVEPMPEGFFSLRHYPL